MKKLNTIFAVALFVATLALTTTQRATAQILLTGRYSSAFEFPDGPSEWSKPVAITLTSEKFEKKGLEGVPLEFRMKVTKKGALAITPCKYKVEVKNLSDKQGISFAARNDYTDVLDKYIYHKVKLKAGATATFDIAYWRLGLGAKTKEDCTTCSWSFVFEGVKPN